MPAPKTSNHLATAIDELVTKLNETDPGDSNKRDTIQAEIAVISAAWGVITGDDYNKAVNEFSEAAWRLRT